MNWDDLRVFLAVARAGRVTAAARALGVEHTTVSRRLAAFERELGVALFYRTASGHRLTPEGESILSSAEAMERAAVGVGPRARERAGKIAGRVRIALVDELASHWLAPLLPAFRARYPEVDLQLLVGIQPLDLSRGEAELAIRSPRPRQPGLAGVRLARAPVGLYASRGWLGSRRLRIDGVEAARGQPLLVYLPEFHALQNAAWFQPVLAVSKVVLSTNSSHTLLAAARAGAGIAVVPRFMTRGYDELVSVSDDVAAGELWLVSHPEFRREPQVRATAEFLRRAVGPNGVLT